MHPWQNFYGTTDNSCLHFHEINKQIYTILQRTYRPFVYARAQETTAQKSRLSQSYSSKEDIRDVSANWTANIYCIRKLWWCKYCWVAKEIVKNFTPSINLYTSLDKDISMALGQNVRNMMSLKICFKMNSVILENPDNPLTFYMCMYTCGQKQKTE